MLRDSQPEQPKSLLRGAGALAVAVAIIVVLLYAPPAYRFFVLVFFLISLVIGIVVAGILHFWNKYRPVKEEDINNKRPLGLS